MLEMDAPRALVFRTQVKENEALATRLISTLLLQTHAWQLYSPALTRFCSIGESSTTNVWDVRNVSEIKSQPGTFPVPVAFKCHLPASFRRKRVAICS